MNQVKMILRNLPVSLARVPLMLLCIFIAILSLPFRLIENLIYLDKIRNQEINKFPVFIIGHWRSGTTFLHQLLSNDKQFGYVNFYAAMFPNSFLWTEKTMKPFLNKLSGIFKWKIPFFNNIKYDFDFPCEEDTAMLNMGSQNSAYWAYALPKQAMELFSHTMYFDTANSQTAIAFINDYRFFLKKISLKHSNKRLLLKSPPNTARIRLLLKSFPEAKFIYISRNPVELYYSHQKLWKQCLQHYALQKIDQTELDSIIIQTMKNMLLQYKEDSSLLNRSNLYEVNYEKLKSDPLLVIKEIYDCLEIPGFNNAEKLLLAGIDKSRKYRPFFYQYDPEKIKWIEENMTA